MHHNDLAEWWLREAIKELVARDGHPDVRLDAWEREITRAYCEAFAKRGLPYEDDQSEPTPP